MPCRDYLTDEEERLKARQNRDIMARALCYALSFLEANKLFDELVASMPTEHSEEIQTWWGRHKKADAAEKQRLADLKEKKRKGTAALKKLTAEDLGVLKELGLLDLPVKPKKRPKGLTR